MNARIKEFSDKARSYAANYEVGSPMWMNFYNEKFAELIVRECADVVRTSLLPSQNKVPATVALDIAAKNIELLFGVEE